MRVELDYNRAPLLLIWEVTRACALACRHCRAAAEDRRDPRELSTEEGKRLIDAVREMGTPLVIFTGGDPLQRVDLEELIRHGKAAGLRVGAIPAATERLTRERVVSLKDAGLDQMAVSIDASTAARHDEFRKVEGTFDRAMNGARWAREIGLPLQVNTVLGDWNVDDFDAIAALVESLGVVFWEVFFLVPTGRGAELKGCSAEQTERLLERLYDVSLRVPFIVKVTEAQHIRRVAAQRAEVSPGDRPKLMLGKHAVNAGRGFCFVDHIGDIHPSGFLPIPAGNVRTDDLASVYRDAPVFRALRDSTRLTGRCRACEYRDLCSGGSRARAYALTGDIQSSDPLCVYQPSGAFAASTRA